MPGWQLTLGRDGDGDGDWFVLSASPIERNVTSLYRSLLPSRVRPPSDDVVGDDELRQGLPRENQNAQLLDSRIAAGSRQLPRVVNQHDMAPQ